MRLEVDQPDQPRPVSLWRRQALQRWRGMSLRRRAGAVGALLILANEVRGVIVVITIGLEPLRVMLAAI